MKSPSLSNWYQWTDFDDLDVDGLNIDGQMFWALDILNLTVNGWITFDKKLTVTKDSFYDFKLKFWGKLKIVEDNRSAVDIGPWIDFIFSSWNFGANNKKFFHQQLTLDSYCFDVCYSYL